MENNNNKEQQVNIELPEDIATGVYSNLAIITHSPTEFVTDFIYTSWPSSFLGPYINKSTIHTQMLKYPVCQMINPTPPHSDKSLDT